MKHSIQNNYYGLASLSQTAKGNDKIGSSGVQKFQYSEAKNFYCAGAGFLKPPKVKKLNDNSEPPQIYSEGLKGGKGYNFKGEGYELEGGFGGGGATFNRLLNGRYRTYYGCGGGYTGGSSRSRDFLWSSMDGYDEICDGGGGGSFAADPHATFDHQFEKYGKCKIEFLN